MPTNKDLKRLVRRRMTKTGESYTAARAQLTRTASPASRAPARKTSTSRSRPAPRSSAAVDYAKLAGMSDKAIKAGTGCDWKKWVDALDYLGAQKWPHPRISKYVHEKFKIDGWWAQAVAVGYERVRGLREIGQQRDGSYEATKSRTLPAPAAAVFKAFTEARARARWLPGIELTIRKSTPNRSVRMTWEDGTSVEVWLTAKGEGKTSTQVQHRKLPDKATVARSKAFWMERLEALEELLT